MQPDRRPGARAFCASRCDHGALATAGREGAADHGRSVSLDSRRHGGARLGRAARARARLPRPHRLDSPALRDRLMSRIIHIIGAGLAGLAAAVELTTRGQMVVVHEATTVAGGRCRSYYDNSVGMTIDNGNHLLLSGNRAALAYARAIGAQDRLIGPSRAEFAFFDLANREKWTLRFNDGRVPWWIFDPRRRVPGTHALDYLAVGRLLWAPRDHAVGEVIRFSGTLYERLLRPLLLAALNIDPAAGSAALAGAIIRETIAAGGKACRPLIAREGLGATLVEPALDLLGERDAHVQFGHQLHAIRFADERVTTLDFGKDSINLTGDDAVILAVPPYVAAALIPGIE